MRHQAAEAQLSPPWESLPCPTSTGTISRVSSPLLCAASQSSKHPWGLSRGPEWGQQSRAAQELLQGLTRGPNSSRDGPSWP